MKLKVVIIINIIKLVILSIVIIFTTAETCTSCKSNTIWESKDARTINSGYCCFDRVVLENAWPSDVNIAKDVCIYAI